MLFFILSVVGCSEPTKKVDSDCVLSEEHVAPARIAEGDLLWLPSPVGSCEPWTLAEGASTNAVRTNGEWSSITVDGVGTHRFQSGDLFVEVDVIPSDDVPFHNVGYYPGRSIAQVDSAWWVAQAYSPEISVIEDGELRTEIAVGPWPVALALHPNGDTVYVATRANDSIGVVSVAHEKIVNSIHVGDEPTHIAIHPDGEHAFVALNTEGVIAVVDLAKGTVLDRWPAVEDISAFDLSPDGSKIAALAHRSGRPERTPLESDDIEDEIDGVLIDTTTGSVVTEFINIGGTNNSVLFAPDGESFYFTTTLGDNGQPLTSGLAFEHRVRRIDASSGQIVADVDLTRQDSSNGVALTPHQLSLFDGALWVVAEGSSALLKLDAETLEEITRAEANGLPRDVMATASGVMVHGGNDYLLHRFDLDATLQSSTSMGTDPRTPTEALGQQLFFGPGDTFATNYACNSCHTDGRGDTRVWQAGPLEVHEVSRALFWLEGTAPLGWSGYTNSVRNFGVAGTAAIGASFTTEETVGLRTYLASIMPPPAANHRTAYDGTLSEQALRGQELFNGTAGCIGCHGGPLATNNDTYDNGITYDQTNTPSLVGVYRHGVWMKHGEATTYDDAVEQVLDWMGNDSLSDDEKDDLMVYLESMTDRDLFVLNDGFAGRLDVVGVDRDLMLTLNQPVWADSVDVSLTNSTGEPVDIDVTIDNRNIVISPTELLAYDTAYLLVLNGAQAFDGRELSGTTEWNFTTAKAPSVTLDGTYVWTVDIPAFNPTEGTFDESNLLPFPHTVTATATPSGAWLAIEYTGGSLYELPVIIDDKKLITTSLPVSFGNSAADSTGMDATLLDTDEDGVANIALGRTRVTGPGIWLEEMAWELKTAIPPDACEEGLDGDFDITVSQDTNGIEINWEGTGALGFFVTDYPATLPVGPGQTVSNGEAYWAVQTASFPDGFSGPIVYGVLPEGAREASEENGATIGGAQLGSGMCVKFSVIRDDFTISSRTQILE